MERGRKVSGGGGGRGGLISKEESFNFIRAYIIFRISQKFAPFFL